MEQNIKFFVGLQTSPSKESPRVHSAAVMQSPITFVRSRYIESLENLPRAMAFAHEAVVFDNSQAFNEHYRKRDGQKSEGPISLSLCDSSKMARNFFYRLIRLRQAKRGRLRLGRLPLSCSTRPAIPGLSS